jgi:hypothetical protein
MSSDPRSLGRLLHVCAAQATADDGSSVDKKKIPESVEEDVEHAFENLDAARLFLQKLKVRNQHPRVGEGCASCGSI